MARRRSGKASIPWVVRLAAALVVLSALILLAAPVGYRLGILPLRTALLTVLRWGAYGAGAAAAVSVLGLGFQLAQPRNARRGVWLSVVSLLLAGVMFSIPAGYRVGPRKPPIHDITTDFENPPPFVAVVPLNTPGRTDYEGEVIAAQQREAYPDLRPAVLDVPPRRRSSGRSQRYTKCAGSWWKRTSRGGASRRPTPRSGSGSRTTS